MADTAVAITAGTGTNIDTRTEATNGNHRQVIVIGDPSTNAGVAPVDATSGVKVNLGADNDVTVTGTVDLGATDNAVLDDIAANQTDASQKTQIVDGAGNVIGSTSNALDVNIASGSSSGTEYTEDAAAPANPAAPALSLVRDDVLSGQTTTDGDIVTARGTDKGEIYVKHADDVTIADGGNSITVDGTVAATQSGTWNVNNISGTVSLPTGAATAALQTSSEAILTTIDADTGNIATNTSTTAAGFATEGSALGSGVLLQGDDGTDRKNINVDATTGDVQVDVTNTVTVDLGANNDVVQSTHDNFNANANVQQGDADVGAANPLQVTLANTGANATPVVVDLGANNDVTVTGTVTANLGATDNAVLDQIELNTNLGALLPAASTDWKYADINDSTSGNNTIIAAQGASNKIAVWAIAVVSDGTTDVRFEDGAGGTAFTGQIPLQAREGFTIAAGGSVPLFVGTANTLLNLELTAAVNVHGFVSYTVVT